eukprot:307591-Pleurochrysis_carterae.AAC.1
MRALPFQGHSSLSVLSTLLTRFKGRNFPGFKVAQAAGGAARSKATKTSKQIRPASAIKPRRNGATGQKIRGFGSKSKPELVVSSSEDESLDDGEEETGESSKDSSESDEAERSSSS